VKPDEITVARQRFGKHVPDTTNIHATIEELMEAVFYMRSVSLFQKFIVF
jgi:hypothetical protein